MGQGLHSHWRSLVIASSLAVGLGTASQAIAIPVVRDFANQPLSGPQTQLPAAKGSSGNVVKAIEKGDFATAVRLASDDLARSPRDPQAQLLFVLANAGAGNYAAVRRHMDELTKTAPNLASSLRASVAGYYMTQGRFQRASTMVAAIPAAVATPEVQLLRANLAATQGNVKAAITMLKSLADDTQSSQHDSVLLNLARLSLMQGDATHAAQYAQQLEKRSPGNETALVLLASASLQNQDYVSVRDASERVLAKDPKNALARFMLGLGQFLDGDFRAAAASFAATGNADGQTGSLLASLAAGAKPAPSKAAPADGLQALAIAAQRVAAGETVDRSAWAACASIFPDLARTSFDAGKYQDFKDAIALRTLATAAFLQRHVGGKPAQQYLAKATAGGGPFLDVIRARVGSGDLRPASARPILEKAAKRYPDLASIAIDLADVEFQAGNGDKAVAIYRDAIKRFTDMPQLRIRLGDLLNALGKPKDAVTEYEAALKAFPQDNYLHNQLAATLTLVGDTKSGERAVSLIDAAIARARPQDKQFLEDTRAGALYVAGRKSDALASYRSLQSGGFAFGAESWSRYGRLLLEQKDAVGGLRALEHAVDAGGTYPGREADVGMIERL